MMETKLAALRERLRGYESVLIAYSGGVDSALLALVAFQELGDRSTAVIADSPSLPRSELQDAQDLAAQFGFPLEILETREFEDANYSQNPINRCYFCKSALFTEMIAIARERNIPVIAYGETASDVGDFRPGGQAAEEFHVCSPLKEVGLSKPEIRTISESLGLPTADKPEMACLSSRVPHGEPVTKEKLGMVERAEAALNRLGFPGARVRHHELSNGALARIELAPDRLAELCAHLERSALIEELKSFGYSQVTVDLAGYRRAGSEVAATREV